MTTEHDDTSAIPPSTGGALVVAGKVPKDGGLPTPYWEAKFRNGYGQQVKRRIGPAYLINAKWDPENRQLSRGEGWRRNWIEPTTRAGRPKAAPDGLLNVADAEARLRAVMAEYDEKFAAEEEKAEKIARAKAAGSQTLEAAGEAWLTYAATVKGMRASTVADYRLTLGQLVSEPQFRQQPAQYTAPKKATPAERREVAGRWPAKALDKITTADLERLRDQLLADGLSARTVNKTRQLLSNIFGFAVRSDAYPLVESNPATAVEKVKEARPARIDYYEAHEVEHLARVLREGGHRKPKKVGSGKREKGRGTIERDMTADEQLAADLQDEQDAALVTVLAFAGLRLGEALALRWREVNFESGKLEVWRSYSGGVEGPTKGNAERFIPMASQVTQTLAKLSQRKRFTGRDDLVFPGVDGGFMDASAFRRRYKAACRVAELRELRIHDLRHGFLSQAAKLFAPQDVQRLGGHADPRTTARYLHGKPAPDEADKLTKLFSSGTATEVTTPTERAPAAS